MGAGGIAGIAGIADHLGNVILAQAEAEAALRDYAALVELLLILEAGAKQMVMPIRLQQH